MLEEARAQARVNHPNVVHVYYVSRSEHQPYLAMELAPNGTVADLLKGGQLCFADVVDIGLQVAHALRASSKLQIVHGDIKPSNVLLSGRTAKLSDFGLARCLAGKLQSESNLSGTPNYMAPELCDGADRSVQSDMYAFGVMLYEMTFARLPFQFTGNGLMSRLMPIDSDYQSFLIHGPRISQSHGTHFFPNF